jgi:hypothetical protein
MSAPSLVLRLIDIIKAIERIRGETAGTTGASAGSSNAALRSFPKQAAT